MGKPKKPSPAELRNAFITDLTAVWEYTQKKYGKDRPYLLALYGVEGGKYAELSVQVLTEAGLTRIAKSNVANGVYETLEESRENLRYSIADSPLFNEYDKLGLPTVAKLTPAMVGKLDETEGYQVLAKAGIAAFNALDKKGFFGKGKAREGLVLQVYTEDTEEDWSLKSVKLANPKLVYDRYDKHTASPPRECTEDLAPSADGKRVYQVMEYEYAKGEDRLAVAAYEVREKGLKQLWMRDWPRREDRHIEKILATPEGRHLIVLFQQYSEVGIPWTCEFVRFDARTGRELETCKVNGQPISLGISPDGRHIALGTRGGDLILLDAKLQPKHKVPLDDAPDCLVFRKNGELLAGLGLTITRVNPSTGKIIGSVKLPSAHLRLSADEKLMAVSRRARIFEENAFGAAVVSLPGFKVVQEIKLPGHQVTLAEISPDGRLFAAEVQKTDSHRHEVVVIDRKTGQTLLRRKTWGRYGARFLPDSRRLIAINSECFKGKSLAVWEIPES